MTGMLLWKSPGKREKAVTVREKDVLHARFLCAEVSQGAKTPAAVLRRRIAAAGKQLGRLGVRRIVLPADFSYGAQLEKWAIRPVSTLPLRWMLAADWVRWSLAERGLPAAPARVVVYAQRLTGEVVRTVTELSLRHRYVFLDLPYGGEELCRALRREYGVSLLLGPTGEQQAEALVLFDPRQDCRGPGVIALYDETAPLPPISLPPAAEEALPPGIHREQVLSALREAGMLKAGQVAFGGPRSRAPQGKSDAGMPRGR